MPVTARSYIGISLDGAWEARMTYLPWCWTLVKRGVLVKRGELQGKPAGMQTETVTGSAVSTG